MYNLYGILGYQERQEQYGITDGGWWTWETGEEGRTYEGRYVDRQHTCLSFFAEETSEEEGYAKIQFGESINREYADGRAASRYFSFEDTEDSEFCLESPPQVYIEYSLEELCGESTAIVKASYVSRTELDLFLGIHVFKLEKDFIGNIEETYLHLYGEGRKRFEKGESYYLFLREDPSPLYPHIVYHLTGSVDGYQKEENISPAIKEEVKKGNYSVKEEEKTVEEDYQNADLIYRVKITGVEALNPFEQGCSGEISEVIRARYGVARRWVGNMLYIRTSFDVEPGEEFFVLEDKEKIGTYVEEEKRQRGYRLDSPEGRYLQKQIEAGNDKEKGMVYSEAERQAE